MNAPDPSARTVEAEYELIPLGAIEPSNTAIQHHRRQRFDPAALAELAQNVAKLGVLQPLVLRPHPNPRGFVLYELVAGERRLLAAGKAGLGHVPAKQGGRKKRSEASA